MKALVNAFAYGKFFIGMAVLVIFGHPVIFAIIFFKCFMLF